ncbi:MAG TPA: TIGR02996 domain-containing protein [Kofleriaceae bacterium]|nr:TIGR02996 domain-containing protein [Kofleriaceae bacterium]
MKLFGDLTCPRCGGKNVTPHMTPLLPEGEADLWAPVRDEAYRCSECLLLESCLNSDDAYEAFRNRWNDPIEVLSAQEHQALIEARLREDDEAARAWTWPTEDRVTDRDRRAVRLAENRNFSAYDVSIARERDVTLPMYKYGFPVGEEFVARILSNPDDDTVRWEYAAWLREHETDAAGHSGGFVEWQLRLAESFRADPRADIKSQLPDRVFSSREQGPEYLPDQPWWRFPGVACLFGEIPGIGEQGLGESTRILREEGLIDRELFYRGFVEHVAMKASRFLELADELYSLAPIRHLTLTYCKGLDHRDTGVWRALLESPHLDRIRSLRLPVRAFGLDNEYTELNRLTDADLELLAGSTHLRGLAHLDLEDQTHLTVRGFDALATSRNLPALSFVGHDINRYGHAASFTFGNFGKPTRELVDRPLARYAPEIEARRGRIPWLHPVENYGTETPDLEAVVEHPVALLAPCAP